MLHHIELYVADLERSLTFWTPLMELLGYRTDRWSGGMNYIPADERTDNAPYLCLLPAPKDHVGAGYHRKRIGLNHLAFRGRSREHVDAIAEWAKQAGHSVLYEDRYPFATGPDYYAMFCEDPDRIKIEVVAP